MFSVSPFTLGSSATEQYVERRLRGTIWQNIALAHGAYRACLEVGRALGQRGISPNALTYTSLAIAGLSGLAAAFGYFAVAALLLAVSGVCDILDGAVARASGRTTRYGALLDSTVDRLADALPLLGLIVFYAPSRAAIALAAFAMLSSFAVSYVRARAEALGADLPPLFMRRAERFVFLAVSLLLGALPLGPTLPARLTLAGVSLMGLLSAIGTVVALRAAERTLHEVESARARAKPRPSATKSGRHFRQPASPAP
jgi:CDP-diacylglycerol---glycerol-3-phosphate 3-phosphatidyltransferase